MTFSGGKTVAACDSMHCGTAHGVRGIGERVKTYWFIQPPKQIIK